MLRNWQWLPVRCCCGPQKLFGFLRVADDHDYSYLVGKQSGGVYQIGMAMRPLSERDRWLKERPDQRMTIVTLRMFYNEVGGKELAVSSEDRPIEFWRQFEYFVEAKEGR